MKFIITIIILIYLILLLFKFSSSIGNGYQYMLIESDDSYIIKDNEIIINHAVLDINVISPYVIGIRLPAEGLECNKGKYMRIVMKNIREYFILNTANGSIQKYNEKHYFLKELKRLDIYKYTDLKYNRFKMIWEKYSPDYAWAYQLNHNNKL